MRRDCNIVISFPQEYFTIEPYEIFYSIVKKNRMTFPKDVFYRYVKEMISNEQLNVYKSFIIKIYKESLEGIDRTNIEKLVHKLKDLYESRKLLSSMNDIVSNVDKFDLQKAKKKLQKSIYIETLLNHKYKGEYLEDYEERKKLAIDKKENPRIFAGIPTGIKEFDALSGGLMKGEFGIVVAPTGKGKSLALGNFAANAWRDNFNVLIVSLEMTKEQIQYRIDSRITKILHQKFRKGDLEDRDFKIWETKMNRLKKKKKNFMEFVCLHRGCCALDIEEEAMKIQVKRKQPVDLIIVDYINLMNSNNKRGERRDWKEQTEVAWNLKELSMDFNGTGIPIWTANQLTDEGQKAKKLETHHLKYARGISEVAPVIIWLNQSIDDELQDIMKLWILKCRDFGNLKRPIILHPKFNIMSLNNEIKTIRTINEEKSQ